MPRDRIFSLLSLCGEGAEPSVDYEISSEGLLAQVFGLCKTSLCICTLLIMIRVLQIRDSRWNPTISSLYPQFIRVPELAHSLENTTAAAWKTGRLDVALPTLPRTQPQLDIELVIPAFEWDFQLTDRLCCPACQKSLPTRFNTDDIGESGLIMCMAKPCEVLYLHVLHVNKSGTTFFDAIPQVGYWCVLRDPYFNRVFSDAALKTKDGIGDSYRGNMFHGCRVRMCIGSLENFIRAVREVPVLGVCAAAREELVTSTDYDETIRLCWAEADTTKL